MVESEANAVAIDDRPVDSKVDKSEKFDSLDTKKHSLDESIENADVQIPAKKPRLEGENGNSNTENDVKLADEKKPLEKNGPEAVTRMDNETSIPDKSKATKESSNEKVTEKSSSEDEEKSEILKSEDKRTSKDTEVVNGLEMSVECASDKEVSDSDNENKDDDKPRPKTIIVKAKPNAGELEVSGDDEETPSDKSGNKTKRKKAEKSAKSTKKIQKPKDKKALKNGEEDLSELSKKTVEKESDSEENEKVTPKSIKNKKSTSAKEANSKKSVAGKKLKDQDKKVEKTSDSENSDVENNSSLASRATKLKNDDENSKKDSESEHSDDGGDDDDNDDDEKASKSGKNTKKKSEDSKKIKSLKKYVGLAGIKVRSYNDIYQGSTSESGKIKKLKEFLEQNGVKGTPTIKKCELARAKRERAADLSQLDAGNIISEGRVTRSRAAPRKTSPIPETSTPPKSSRGMDRKTRPAIVDSDSE